MDVLKQLLPFHLVFDAECRILGFGRSLALLWPKLAETGGEAFVCIEAREKTLVLDLADCAEQATFPPMAPTGRLKLASVPLWLNYEIVNSNTDDGVRVLNLSPGITSLKETRRLGLGMKDFAKTDPTLDFMFLQKALHVSLEDSEDLVEQLQTPSWMEILPDACALVNRTGNIVYFNSLFEELFGYKTHQLATLPIEALIPDRFRLGHVERRSQYAANPKKRLMGTGLGIFAQRQDGTSFPCEISLGPHRYKGTNCVLVAVRNTTEAVTLANALKEQKAQLVRSNQDLEQYAYVASHDLQEPLRMIASYAQLLERRYRGKLDPDADKYIEFLVDGAKRMKVLISDLLSLSRASVGSLNHTAVELDDVVTLAQCDLKMLMNERNVKLVVEPLPTITGDKNQLVQVFMNLFTNAIKFCAPDTTPEIRVTAEEHPEEHVVVVADNGIGISSEFKERIFEIFERLHTKEEYAGTGIGLSLCRRIMERHNGRIWVAPGEVSGSRFYVRFPKSIK